MGLAAAIMLLIAAAGTPASAETTFFVAPAARGAGTGDAAADAAALTPATSTLWTRVQSALAAGPVTVKLVDGDYLLYPHLVMSGLGHPVNRLTIEGETENGVTLRKSTADSGTANLWGLTACQNMLLRNLHFRGPGKMGYAINFGSGCHDIEMNGCSWKDMLEIIYGATGSGTAPTRNITWRNCVFERIGSGTGTHMIYNAYGVRNLKVYGCTFIDCSGDYVRFRDETDDCEVRHCTFRSTWYFPDQIMFITIPLFNDDNPATNPANPNYEYFGTHFVFAHNSFSYPEGRPSHYAIGFYHNGFNPPGRNHLLTEAEGNVLIGGTEAQKKALLLANMGIDTSQVHVYDNEFLNMPYPKVTFGSFVSYGAVSLGWTGWADIEALVSGEPVTTAVAA